MFSKKNIVITTVTISICLLIVVILVIINNKNNDNLDENVEFEKLRATASRITSIAKRRNFNSYQVHLIKDGRVITDVKFPGPLPETGIIVVNEENESALALFDNGLCATKGFKSEIVIGESNEGCTHANVADVQKEYPEIFRPNYTSE